MKIKYWTKKIYGDSTIRESDILDYLKHSTLPTGKRIISTDKGIGEIDVVGANVDDEEFAPLNVCPVGTIHVDDACIEDAKTVEPTAEIDSKDNTWNHPTKKCPEGYVPGDKIEKITILGPRHKIKSAGIEEKANELFGIDVKEVRGSEAMKVDVKSSLTCVKKEPMPLTEKNLRIVTDSVIGWGGYGEFPYWNLNWDYICKIADIRYKNGGDILKGYPVHYSEYKTDYYFLFKDKKEADSLEKTFKYWNSNEFFEDTKNYLKEEMDEGFIEKKEITDEQVFERMNEEQNLFFEDIEDMFESYIGMHDFEQHGLPAKFETGKVYVASRQRQRHWTSDIVIEA